MTETLTLAIDQGTHATRVLVFDDHGQMVAHARRPVSLQARSRAEVEQSPLELLDSLQAVVDEILLQPGIDAARIGSAGLATQRSSVLAWERETGRALSPVLSWQDTRTAADLATLDRHEAVIRERTGLRLSPHYGAGKLRWLLRHEADVIAARAQGALVIGPLASFLLHHLSEASGEVADHANASRTLLWNLESRDWDTWLLDLFDIPRDVLPACRPIVADYGLTRIGRIPLTAVNGDQTAALYAQGMPAHDTLVVNAGTGAFVLLPTGDSRRSHPELLSGLSRSDGRTADYYLEGTVNGAASALDWVANQYRIADWSAQASGWLDEVEAPPVFLNSIGGLGSPWWRPGPDPVFLPDGNGAHIEPAQALVAAIESIVFLIQANVELLRELNPGVQGIRIGGGLAPLDGLCRKLANLSGLAVERSGAIESTARGIAWLAAGCPQSWEPPGVERRFLPQDDPRLRERYACFRAALESAFRQGP
ncbi:MAG: FGGY family carbohydrate kinase [Gammaproteobacteria bacterium]